MGVRPGRTAGQHAWTKTESATIHELVCETASALLHAHDDDETLKSLFARHAGVDFATERQERMRAMKDMARAVTGLDLDDIEDVETEGEFFERVQQGLYQLAAAEEAERATKTLPHRKQAQDMHMLADPAATKRWLKKQRQMLRSVAFDF